MQDRRQKLIFGSWVTVLSIILLTTATYAWMSIASNVAISDLELNVVTDNALEIALDAGGEPGEWTTILPLGELLGANLALAPATWSAQRGSFCSVQYGPDGRPDGVKVLDDSGRTLIQTNTQETAPAEAEAGTVSGYLIALDLWLRTGSDQTQVALSEAVERVSDTLGAGTWVVGEPVWDAGAVRHTNGGNGAEQVIRMAFRSYDEEYDTGGFVIYEPNAGDGEAPTSSIDGGPLEGGGKLIRQGTTTWEEQNPVLRDNVNYQMGAFLGEDTTILSLNSDTPRKFTLFIWLEGQDEQCTNAISDGKVLINLQFSGKSGIEQDPVYRPADGKPTEPTEAVNEEEMNVA